jgi:hypothetical protein
VFQEGSLPPAVHPVVKEEKYCGEVKLALTFTPAAVRTQHFLPAATAKQAFQYMPQIESQSQCMHATLIDLIFSRKLAALMTTRRGRLTAAGVDLSAMGCMHHIYPPREERIIN